MSLMPPTTVIIKAIVNSTATTLWPTRNFTCAIMLHHVTREKGNISWDGKHIPEAKSPLAQAMALAI